MASMTSPGTLSLAEKSCAFAPTHALCTQAFGLWRLQRVQAGQGAGLLRRQGRQEQAHAQSQLSPPPLPLTSPPPGRRSSATIPSFILALVLLVQPMITPHAAWGEVVAETPSQPAAGGPSQRPGAAEKASTSVPATDLGLGGMGLDNLKLGVPDLRDLPKDPSESGRLADGARGMGVRSQRAEDRGDPAMQKSQSRGVQAIVAADRSANGQASSKSEAGQKAAGTKDADKKQAEAEKLKKKRKREVPEADKQRDFMDRVYSPFVPDRERHCRTGFLLLVAPCSCPCTRARSLPPSHPPTHPPSLPPSPALSCALSHVLPFRIFARAHAFSLKAGCVLPPEPCPLPSTPPLSLPALSAGQ